MPRIRADRGKQRYRRRTPLALRNYLQKAEIIVTLPRCSPSQANALVRRIDRLIERAIIMTDREPNADIDTILRQWIADALEDADMPLLTSGGQYRRHMNGLEGLSGMIEADLEDGILREAVPIADDLIAQHSLNLQRGSQEYRAFLARCMKAQIELVNRERKLIEDTWKRPFAPPTEARKPEPEKPSGPPLSKVMAAYVAEQSWRPKTEVQVKRVFGFLTAFLGNVPADQVTKARMREFKVALASLPPNYGTAKGWKGLPFKKAVSKARNLPDDAPRLSPGTINKHFHMLSGFFNWAKDHDYIPENPASRMSVRVEKLPHEHRDIFTRDELERLFTSPIWTGAKSARFRSTRGKVVVQDAKYWVPLISAYAGLRMQEASQLQTEDIREVDGVLVFDINNRHPRTLKTRAAARLVPVHPVLVKLGLLEKAKGEGPLFPELPQGGDRAQSEPVSKFFVAYRKKVGLKRKGTPMHSLRANFINSLKQTGVSEAQISELAGHELQGESMGRYGKRFRPDVQLKAVEKVSYGISIEE